MKTIFIFYSLHWAFYIIPLCAQVSNTDRGHSQSVISLDYSPDGKYLLSGSNDSTIKLWDLSSGQLIRTDPVEELPPEVHFSPDGILYASISIPNQGSIHTKIRQTQTGITLASWESIGGYGCFAENGHMFIYKNHKNSKLKNPLSKSYDFKLKNLEDEFRIEKIGVSKNGKIEVHDNALWNEGNYKLYDENTDEYMLTNFIEISEDNNYVLSGEKGIAKRYYSIHDKHAYLQIYDILRDHPTVFENIPFTGTACFSPDSRYMIYGRANEKDEENPETRAGYPDSCIVIYDIKSQSEFRKINIHNILTAIAFSPDGKYLAYGVKKDGIIRILDFESGELISTLGGTSKAKPNLASDGLPQPFRQKFEFVVQTGVSGSPLVISQDGKYAVSSVSDMQIKLWDLNTRKEIRTFKGSGTMIGTLCISPDNNYVVSNGQNDSIIVWDPLSGKKIRAFIGSEPYLTSLTRLTMTKDGTKILAAYNNAIALFDFKTGNVIKTYQGFLGEITSVCLTPDEKQLLTSNFDKTVKFWDVETEMQLRSFGNDPECVVYRLAVSPDGITYASCYDNSMAMALKPANERTPVKHKVSIKKISNNEIIKTFYLSASPHGIKYSPDGNYLVFGGEDSLIHIVDTKSLKEVNQLKFSDYFSSFDISPDNRLVVAVTGRGSIKFVDLLHAEEIQKSNELKDWLFYSHYNPSQNTLLVSGRNTYTWNLSTLRYEYAGTRISSNWTASCMVSPNEKYMAESKYDTTIIISDLLKRKIIATLKGHSANIGALCFSPDSKILASGSFNGIIKLWNVEKSAEIRTLTGHDWDILNLKFSQDGSKIASSSMDGKVILWDVNTGEQLKVIKRGSNVASFAIAFTSDGNNIVCGYEDDKVIEWDIQSGERVKEFDVIMSYGIRAMILTADNKQLITGSYGGLITVWEMESGRFLKTLPGSDGMIMSLSISPDQKRIFSASYDGAARIIDLETGEYISFMIKENNEWMVYTSDGYWDASRNGSSFVAMVRGLSNFNVDQFALKNNRPDIILQRLESTDKDLISHYCNQYKKRLRRSGITEDQLSSDLHVPQVNNLNQTLNGKQLRLSFTLDDNKFNLRYYQVFINDVPVFTAPGKEITGQNHLNISETIELTIGSNKIEVSCTNEKGQESYRVLTYANYTGEIKGDFYFLAFGVSKYQNPSYNLQFADKDALDLDKIIQSFKGKGFENIYTKVLTNEQVTPDAIRAAKDFVKNAKVDDTFVLFIAGHGIHDTDPEATYYFLTSNADLKNLKGTAADFETIEDLLQGIPPRNKLFLMDACESGEIDEEEQGQMMATATGVGINSRGFKVLQASTSTGSVAGASPKRTYLFQKERYIYNDLVRRSGAIVFSSSKGGELSYERSDIENGLFTEYIMKALTTSEADKDGNGFVSTDELREYVSTQVAKASGDLQHPTVDRDNIYQKFGFQIK